MGLELDWDGAVRVCSVRGLLLLLLLRGGKRQGAEGFYVFSESFGGICGVHKCGKCL